jgi:uncharacterized membrane protein
VARRDRARRADLVDRWGWIAVAIVWILVGLLLHFNVLLTVLLAAVAALLVAWNGRARIQRRIVIEQMREDRRREGT